MTTKEYLNQAYRLNELINSHNSELMTLRQLSDGLVSGAQEHVSGGELPGDTRAVNTLAKIVELENKINAEIDSLVMLKNDIHDSINSVSDKDECLLLRYRYIEFMKWENIAERMNFSSKQLQRIHNQALQAINIKKMS